MFSIRQVTEQGFDKWILQDDGSGTTAEIIPGCGAILHAFTVNNGGHWVNVIDGYASAEDFKDNVTAKGFKSCKLSPFVCRLKNGAYHFGQQDYKTDKFYLGKHALHGLLYDAVFSVEETQQNEQSTNITLLHQYRGEEAGYPFAYDCRVTYTLTSSNKLTLTTTIINQSEGLLPIQDGWHPYFGFGGSINDLQLEFQSKERVVFDEELLPTGQLERYELFGSLAKIGDTKLDDCFTVNFAECQPLCVLRDPQQHIQLEIYPQTSYPYLQIYTPDHRQSIAIENLSSAPDGFNNRLGLKVLEAEEEAQFVTAYKISLLA